jgi:hypothetical protein
MMATGDSTRVTHAAHADVLAAIASSQQDSHFGVRREVVIMMTADGERS